MTISTHVLDTASGRPAANLEITLERREAPDDWRRIGGGFTNNDGRLPGFLSEGESLTEGVYRATFFTGAYHEAAGTPGFYPHVEVLFEVRDAEQHYHVPLLLSPFGYSTYRGS